MWWAGRPPRNRIHSKAADGQCEVGCGPAVDASCGDATGVRSCSLRGEGNFIDSSLGMRTNAAGNLQSDGGQEDVTHVVDVVRLCSSESDADGRGGEEEMDGGCQRGMPAAAQGVEKSAVNMAWCAEARPPRTKEEDGRMSSLSVDQCLPLGQETAFVVDRLGEEAADKYPLQSGDPSPDSEVSRWDGTTAPVPSTVPRRDDERQHLGWIHPGGQGSSGVNTFAGSALQRLERSAIAVHHRSCQYRGAYFSGKNFNDTLASSSSLWFTSKPVIVASSRPIFRLVFLGLFVLFFYRGTNFSFTLAANGLIQPAPALYRLRILALRDSTLSPSLCNLLIFGLLLGGCDARPLGDSALARAVGNGSSSLALSFPVPVAADGFYLQVLSGDAERDPARWVVEAAALNASDWEWRVVAASYWTFWGTTVRFHPEIPTTISSRDRRVVMDMRPTWAWAMAEMGVPLTSSFFWLAIAVTGSVRRHDLAKSTMEMMFSVLCILSTTAAAGHFAAERWSEGATSLAIAVGDVNVSLVSLFAQRYTIHAFAVYGTLVVSNLLVQSLAVTKDTVGLTSSVVVNGGFFALLFTSFVLIFRYRALYQARRLVLDDKRKYDEIWAGLMLDPNHYRDLRLVAEAAAQMQAMIKCPARHFHRHSFESTAQSHEPRSRKVVVAPRGEASWDHVLLCGIPYTLDLSRPVDNLDQLNFQATALHLLLIGKVQTWAAESDGYVLARSWETQPSNLAEGEARQTRQAGWRRLRSELSSESLAGSSAGVDGLMSGHFVKWKDICEEVDAEEQVKWSRLKSPHRAIEKATRSYGQDTSLLVDLCRQSIFFDSFPTIAGCIATISRDPEVVLARVKNRLDPAHDASSTAGFRNLSVNLRLVSREAALLGADTHVCEVQLLLISFARIKNEDGHKKYIAFRNLRGE